MANKREIRSAFSDRQSVDVPLSGEPSRTKQEFKKEVNINTIIERMQKGISPPQWMTSNTPHYGDFTGMPASFQEAYEIVERAEAAFASLPLEFRRAIDHDPRNLETAPRELFEKFGLLKQAEKIEQPEAVNKGGAQNSPAAKAPKAPKAPAENADE